MDREYELRDNGGEPATCDCCGFPAPTAQFDWGPPSTAKHDRTCRLLCEFCSTTMASRYNEYPQGDEFGLLRGEMWRAAACVFNAMKFGFALESVPPVGAPGLGQPMRDGYVGSVVTSYGGNHLVTVRYALREQADAAQDWLADGGIQRSRERAAGPAGDQR